MDDDRKRKRMESNRESARRSRMKKQMLLDDLTAQIARLRRENKQLITTVDLTTQRFLSIEAENSVLRGQMSELTQRLDSLNQMVNYVNTLGGSGQFEWESVGLLGNVMGHLGILNVGGFGYLNQPIDVFPL